MVDRLESGGPLRLSTSEQQRPLIFCDAKMEHFGVRVDSTSGERTLAVVDGGDLLFKQRQGGNPTFFALALAAITELTG